MRLVCSGCRTRADSEESSTETGSLPRNGFPGDLRGTGSKRCHKMAAGENKELGEFLQIITEVYSINKPGHFLRSRLKTYS